MLQNFFKNKDISKKLKLRLNTTIDKTLTCASETGTLTERDREQLNVFERKVYRRNLGPVYDNEKENWRILTKKEIYAMFQFLHAYARARAHTHTHIPTPLNKTLLEPEFFPYSSVENWAIFSDSPLKNLGPRCKYTS